jgi:hypothetical protein
MDNNAPYIPRPPRYLTVATISARHSRRPVDALRRSRSVASLGSRAPRSYYTIQTLHDGPHDNNCQAVRSF